MATFHSRLQLPTNVYHPKQQVMVQEGPAIHVGDQDSVSGAWFRFGLAAVGIWEVWLRIPFVWLAGWLSLCPPPNK